MLTARSVRRAGMVVLAAAALGCAAPSGAHPRDAGPDSAAGGAGGSGGAPGDAGADGDASSVVEPDATTDALDAAASDAPEDASKDAFEDAPDASVDAGACSPVGPLGGGGVLDVTAFGAKADGSDAYPGIQAAIQAACATSPRAPVFLPPGTFVTSQPILVDCSLEMYGACRTGTVIAPSFSGPAILLDPPGGLITLNLVPALVGTGNAIDTESDHYYLNLRDVPAVELDGLGAFTAEAFIQQASAYAPGYAGIVGGPNGCQGVGAAIPCDSAFRLGVATQNLTGLLTVGGVAHQLDGPLLALNVVHHVALAYDGATIRLFLDGAVVASTAASGPVSQSPFEDVTIGTVYYPLESSAVNGAMPGVIDSVRLSSVARYVAPFTAPTGKLASDASTLALANFDVQSPGLTQVQSKDGPVWIPVRRVADLSGNGIPFLGNVLLHDLTVQGGMGIFGWLAPTTRLSQIDCVGCDYGVALLGNAYEGELDDVSATAGIGRGRFGVNTHTANGNGFHDVTLEGQVLPFVTMGGAEQVHTNLRIVAGPRTATAITLEGSDDVFDGLTVDVSLAGTAWRGAIATLEPWAKLQVQRGTIGNAGAGIPITIDQGAGVLIEGTSFTGTAGAPEILHVPTATDHPNIVIGGTRDSAVPWSDDPALVSLPTDPGIVPDPTTLPATTAGCSVVRGQVHASQVFDVTTFGAMPGGADATAGIEAAVAAACAAGGTVFLPIGQYYVTHPILVQCAGLTFEGAGRQASLIKSFGTTPAFVLNPPGMTGVDAVPALVGAGNAMQTNGASYWLELRDSDSVELDGLAAFTVEAVVSVASVGAGYQGIVQSYGCLGSGGTLPGCTSAFALAMQGPNVVGSMTVGGQPYALQGPALSLTAVHDLAMTYDGSAIRLFVDGAVVASQPATGALRQLQHEDVSVGPRTVGFDAAAQDPAFEGVIDSVQLGAVALYTRPYTVATSKPVDYPGALITLTFDELGHGAAHAVGKGGNTVWLPVRRTAEPDGTPEGTLAGVTMRSFGVAATLGVFGMNAVGGRYQSFDADGADSSLVLLGTSAGTVFDGLRLASGGRGRYGLLTVGGDGNLHHDLALNYAKIPLAVIGGAGQTFTHVFVTPDPATAVYGSYFLHTDATVLGLYYDNEGPSPVWKGNLVLVDPTARFQLFKGEIDGATNQGTPITIEGGAGVLVEGASFGSSSVAPEILHVNAPTTGVNSLIGVTHDPGSTLSDDPALQSIGN